MSSQQDQSASAPSADAGRQYVPRPSAGVEDGPDYPAGGRHAVAQMSFTMLAAVLMLLSGVWNFLVGLAAIIRGSFFVVTSSNYAYHISVRQWGWVELIVGCVVFAAGLCLFMDMLWARIAGVLIASLSAVANFLYLPYTPIWSIVVIAIDVFIIWALLTPRRRYA
jgi:hypothetical protein